MSAAVAAAPADEPVVRRVSAETLGAVLGAEADAGRRPLAIITGDVGGLEQLRVLADVASARRAQDAHWGGAANDDRLDASSWGYFRGKQERAAAAAAHLGDNEEARRRLVEVAATAVAQVEALDRRAARRAGTAHG